jgi:hypothetical protein
VTPSPGLQHHERDGILGVGSRSRATHRGGQESRRVPVIEGDERSLVTLTRLLPEIAVSRVGNVHTSLHVRTGHSVPIFFRQGAARRAPPEGTDGWGQPHLEAASGFEPEYGALQAPYSCATLCRGVPKFL